MRIKETFSVTVRGGGGEPGRRERGERWILNLCMFSISKHQLAFLGQRDNAKLPTLWHAGVFVL
jgi:hypothetical protein